MLRTFSITEGCDLSECCTTHVSFIDITLRTGAQAAQLVTLAIIVSGIIVGSHLHSKFVPLTLALLQKTWEAVVW
jgi:hypothetical protein